MIYLEVGAILLSLSAGASVALEDETQRYSENCDMPSDVAYCMDVMRVGTRFDGPTAEHFVRLETQLSEHAMEECSWESFDGKQSPEECVSTLSRFVDEHAAVRNPSIDLDVSEHSLDKVCYKACKLVKCLKCKFKWPKKKRKKCKKKCKRKCRKKCDKIF